MALDSLLHPLINISRFISQTHSSWPIKINLHLQFIVSMCRQVDNTFSLPLKEENLWVKLEQNNLCKHKQENSHRRTSKTIFLNGLKIMNKKSLHIITNISIVEYMKRLIILTSNSRMKEVKKWVNTMLFWKSSNINSNTVLM